MYSRLTTNVLIIISMLSLCSVTLMTTHQVVSCFQLQVKLVFINKELMR